MNSVTVVLKVMTKGDWINALYIKSMAWVTDFDSKAPPRLDGNEYHSGVRPALDVSIGVSVLIADKS